MTLVTLRLGKFTYIWGSIITNPQVYQSFINVTGNKDGIFNLHFSLLCLNF